MFKHIPKFIWIVILITSVSLAAEQMDLVAPGGGEMDLKRNVMQYFGTADQPVIVRWGNINLEAKNMDYDRNHEILRCKDAIKLVQSNPVRILKCLDLTVEIKRDYLLAINDVSLKSGDNMSLTGNRLEWDRAKDLMKVTGKPEMIYKEWRMTGDLMEGQVTRGVLTITGQAQIIGNETTAKAGKILYDRETEKALLQQNPIVIRGDNELTATEIIYDLKTKKLSATGEVKSRIVKDNH